MKALAGLMRLTDAQPDDHLSVRINCCPKAFLQVHKR